MKTPTNMHPTYADGRPVLFGDVVDTPDGRGHVTSISNTPIGAIVTVRNRHTNEAYTTDCTSELIPVPDEQASAYWNDNDDVNQILTLADASHLVVLEVRVSTLEENPAIVRRYLLIREDEQAINYSPTGLIEALNLDDHWIVMSVRVTTPDMSVDPSFQEIRDALNRGATESQTAPRIAEATLVDKLIGNVIEISEEYSIDPNDVARLIDAITTAAVEDPGPKASLDYWEGVSTRLHRI
jgi:hypothetical protein